MEVYSVMFHTDGMDAIVAIFSSEEIAKKRAERCAARLYPTHKFSWNGNSLICNDRCEEWTVQEWTVWK